MGRGLEIISEKKSEAASCGHDQLHTVSSGEAPSAIAGRGFGGNVLLVTLGCAKNLVDSEVMLGALKERGFRPIDRAEDADLIVRFGTGRYADLEHVCLMKDEVTPLASPSFVRENGPFEAPEDLEGAGRAAAEGEEDRLVVPRVLAERAALPPPLAPLSAPLLELRLAALGVELVRFVAPGEVRLVAPGEVRLAAEGLLPLKASAPPRLMSERPASALPR